MLHRVWEMACLTVLETRRNHAVQAILLIYLAVLGVSLLLASVTMGSTVDIVINLGLMMMSILGNLAALIITIQTIQQDIERRTVYVLLPRIGFRTLYMIARYIGIALVLTGTVSLMAMMLTLFAAVLDWSHWAQLMQVFCATIIEVWIGIALALLFANATSMFLAVFLTLAVLLAGHFSLVIKVFGESMGGTIEYFTTAAYYLLPNFQAINLRDRVIDLPPLPIGEFLHIPAYGMIETSLILCAACLLFMHKDLHGDG